MEHIITKYEPISLSDMSGVKLMNRTDTKFVTTIPVLRQLLTLARDDYYVQEIGGERNMLYDTTYFDTPDFAMYNAHQHGHANRQKIRFRTYVSSHLQFMEVKTKNNHGRTKKKRIEVTDMDLTDRAKLDFLTQHLSYDGGTLMPHMHNYFHRITLVNKGKTERLTIDTQLEFNNLVSHESRTVDNLVVIELKRDGLVFSPILQRLLELRIKPHGFSKYCMGAALTNHDLPLNRFKLKWREVDMVLKK